MTSESPWLKKWWIHPIPVLMGVGMRSLMPARATIAFLEHEPTPKLQDDSREHNSKRGGGRRSGLCMR